MSIGIEIDATEPGTDVVIPVVWRDHNNVRHEGGVRIQTEGCDKPRTVKATMLGELAPAVNERAALMGWAASFTTRPVEELERLPTDALRAMKSIVEDVCRKPAEPPKPRPSEPSQSVKHNNDSPEFGLPNWSPVKRREYMKNFYICARYSNVRGEELRAMTYDVIADLAGDICQRKLNEALNTAGRR